MTAEFVVRLLDAEARLLAWVTLAASPVRAEGGAASCPFRVLGPTRFVVEQDGTAATIAITWLDLGIARLRALDAPVAVTAGQAFDFLWIEPIWLVAGQPDVPQPQVTERRAVIVAPPVATLGAQPSR